MTNTLSSYERVVAALSFKDVDHVPVFLLLTTHGAKDLGMGIREYFARAENVVEGQLRLQRKFGHDCLFAFFHAGVEAACFGMESLFVDNGPPNLGPPVIRKWEQVGSLETPDPQQHAATREVLRAVDLLSRQVKGKVPIVAVAVGPFGLASSLMGLDGWLELLLFGPKHLVDHVLRCGEEFCVAWARAQLAAGADVVVLADPFLSASIVTEDEFKRLVLTAVTRIVGRIGGPVGLATVGPAQATIEWLSQTGAVAVLVTSEDDLAYCRKALNSQVCVAGNLNNVAMVRWSREDVARNVHACLARATEGGGLILAPEWEVPFAVTDETLAAVVETARCGRLEN